MLEHLGEAIAFVSNSENDWPFLYGSFDDLDHDVDVTDRVVDALVAAGILQDNGRETDSDDDRAYMRLLRNVWLDR